RRAQLRALRPDLEVLDLRGNLNTRLAKLDAGQYEAIILAAAGVLRLGWEERIAERLDPATWLPAVGQGALAVVTRAGDGDILRRLQPLHHAASAACVLAERAFLNSLEGGCQVPIGALATLRGDRLTLDGMVSDTEGTIVLRGTDAGPIGDAAAVGRALAGALLRRGAGEILAGVRADTPILVPVSRP
ncbi:MAG TPA: hydroxymethylbilane synthase, partial [Longimicrobium sp.]|nr:hydroxymethylbilane synthase [Longimicrobium sp.]